MIPEATYSYDDTNRKTTKEVTVDSSGNVGHVETYFDKMYRVVQTKTNDPEGQFAVDTVYDSLGRASKVSNPYRTSGSASAWTYTAYDGIGRTVCTSASTATTSPCDSGGPTDAKVQYLYTGNTTTTINEAGNQRRYTYDARGKMVKVEEPNPSLDTPLVTTYTYDYLGRATQRSYSDSTPTVTFTYDASSQTGLRTSMTDAVGSIKRGLYLRHDEPPDPGVALLDGRYWSLFHVLWL